ncbi:MAG: pyridoxal phosphate-dependent decarboxylase family protein [Acidimicrobiia bacterium]
MHEFTSRQAGELEAIIRYVRWRLSQDMPLDGPRPKHEYDDLLGHTITPDGIGGERALEIFEKELATGCISTDHPRYLAFIPNAPTAAASMFDLVVSASSIYGGSWLEGSGAVWAENQALGWLAERAGYPSTAEGAFVPGGTLGNLSALVAARLRARELFDKELSQRWVIVTGAGSHSSVEHVARVMDVDVVRCPGEPHTARLRAHDVADTLATLSPDQKCFAVITTAGHTNTGIVDDLSAVAMVARAHDLWFHVDGAYGAAVLASDAHRVQMAGIELSDSFIVDPHKWLFTPFDSCALLYRDAMWARRAHAQIAAYLEPQQGEMNPSDLAVHLTRRARGLPFWYSLVANGTRAYQDAIDAGMELAQYARACIEEHPRLEMLIGELSIVVFRRIGWGPDDYTAWSEDLLRRGEGFVLPTRHQRERVLRMAFVNPNCTHADIDAILDQL